VRVGSEGVAKGRKREIGGKIVMGNLKDRYYFSSENTEFAQLRVWREK